MLEGICKRNIKEENKAKFREETRKKQNVQMTRKRYPTDLTDPQWEIIKDMFPAAKSDIAQERKCTSNLREVVNAISYWTRSGSV